MMNLMILIGKGSLAISDKPLYEMVIKRLLKCSYQEANELLNILDYNCIKEIDDQIKIQTKEIDSMLNVLKGQLKQAFVVDTNYNFKENKIIVNLTKKKQNFLI